MERRRQAQMGTTYLLLVGEQLEWTSPSAHCEDQYIRSSEEEAPCFLPQAFWEGLMNRARWRRHMGVTTSSPVCLPKNLRHMLSFLGSLLYILQGFVSFLTCPFYFLKSNSELQRRFNYISRSIKMKHSMFLPRDRPPVFLPFHCHSILTLGWGTIRHFNSTQKSLWKSKIKFSLETCCLKACQDNSH